MGNTVSTLADRALSDRHQAYAAEIRSLLDAALAVMRRDETIDPKVADIVRAARLSNQAFYRHFDGKDALLLTLLADGRERLAATIERRMRRSGSNAAAQVRAWIGAVVDQARDPDAAAATRPFVANAGRFAVEYPEEVARSRDQLVAPLAAIVGPESAVAVYHVTMGLVQDSLAARRAPTRRQVDALTDFAINGCGL
ncbi:MAG: TetR/AcrR family transcriptional regulator [Acidimicrobiia bacterium]